MIKKLNTLRKLFTYENPKIVMWEITKSCNCKCEMCSLWKQDGEVLNLSRCKELVEFMVENDVLIIQLTGGEPTLYKDIIPLVEYIHSKGLIVNLVTNGLTMTESLAKELKQAGLKYINVSIDHYKESVQDRIRGVPGAFNKAVEAINILKQEGFEVYSSTMINKDNAGHVKELVEFINKELSIPVGLCYPYPGFREEDNTSKVGDEKLVHAFKTLLELKKRGCDILNSVHFLEECITYTRTGEGSVSCRAGQNVFCITSNDVFKPCWLCEEGFTPEEGWERKDLSDCNKCNLTCFKEPSVLYDLLKNDKLSLLKEAKAFF